MRSQRRAGNLYTLTEAGEEALSLFGSRVPGSVKKLLETSGDVWRARFQQEDQCRHSIRQTERGEYELTLAVQDQEMDLLRLTLTLPTRELARQMADQWKDRAGQVYEAVIRALSEDPS